MGLNSEACGEIEIGTGKFLGVGGLSCVLEGMPTKVQMLKKKGTVGFDEGGAFQNRS